MTSAMFNKTDAETKIAEARKASRAVYLATDESVAADLSRILNGLSDELVLALAEVERLQQQKIPNREDLADVIAKSEGSRDWSSRKKWLQIADSIIAALAASTEQESRGTND